jgi:hypothetical protein
MGPEVTEMPTAASSPPRRRARDRLAARERTENRTLCAKNDLRNLILFIDDDLRETASAIGDIEGYLVRALRLMEKEDVTPDELRGLAGDNGLDAQIDGLSETLTSLRRRIGQVAEKL